MDHSAAEGWESPAAVPRLPQASAEQETANFRALSALRSEVRLYSAITPMLMATRDSGSTYKT